MGKNIKRTRKKTRGRSVLEKVTCAHCGKDYVPLIKVNLLESETITVRDQNGKSSGTKPKSVTVDVIQTCRNCAHIHGVGMAKIDMVGVRKEK